MDNMVYWIWLSLSCSVGTGTFATLMEKFEDAKSVYDADEYDIISCLGPKISDRSYLVNKDLGRAEEIYTFCKKFHVGILTYADERYPTLLKKISTPPPLLYYRGILPNFNDGFFVSVVGTRKLSEYGRKNAFKISYDLATAGSFLVSGMAFGIDSVAMAGAIAAEKPVVAILGSGIDVCYPSQHLTLARETVKKGCIMTEYPPGTPPAKPNFPKRNRIISGLSKATLVIEGTESSGSVISARFAKEQGRDVFALPGNVGSVNSQATNLLLKNGAIPCTAAEDILTRYEKEYPGKINTFLLKERCPVDMMHTLRTLEVVADCPSDGIYFPPCKSSRSDVSSRSRRSVDGAGDCAKVNVKSSEHTYVTTEDKPKLDKSVCENIERAPSFTSFDKEALKLYKKIPGRGDCAIDELVSEQMPLREVMKLLLKLEMGKFIVMLPGERVARKTK